MFNLKMVDTAGGGIRKMFTYQRDRLFPLPDYDFSGRRVKVTVTGKVLDPDYAEVLSRNKDLSLEEIIMLDKLQKKKSLTETEVQHLRQKKLIEGKKPNLFISAKVAQSTGQKAAYSKYKAFDNEYYQDLVLKAIKEHSFLERSDIDELLWNKLPDWMDDKQRKNKIKNLIANLRGGNKIKNVGSATKPRWILA